MSSLFLSYDINSIHDSCKVVPITPSTWLDEFLEYQLQGNAEILKDLQVDKFWGFMGRKKIASERIFSNLAALMKLPLCIPHSNASSKRTFFVVRKIVTKNRTSLQNDTVCTLLNCRLNCDRSSAGFKPSKQRWSRGHKARGQGHKKKSEAKAKDQGHKRNCSPKRKKRSSHKFFKRSPQKNVFQKFFQALHKILTLQKIVLSSKRGQANFRGLEA